MLEITLADPYSPAAAYLIDAISAEIGAIYGGDGSGDFSPADVLVPGGAFLIAQQDDRPVGCGALRPMREPGVAEVKRIYVDPELRGQHIGERILAQLEVFALAFGYHTLRLETGTRQPAAIRLYERIGYVRISCYGSYQDEPESICFEKRIAAAA